MIDAASPVEPQKLKLQNIPRKISLQLRHRSDSESGVSQWLLHSDCHDAPVTGPAVTVNPEGGLPCRPPVQFLAHNKTLKSFTG